MTTDSSASFPSAFLRFILPSKPLHRRQLSRGDSMPFLTFAVRAWLDRVICDVPSLLIACLVLLD